MNFKIAFVGEQETGKTTFIKRFFEGEYQKEHIPTLNGKGRKEVLHTSDGVIHFEIWEMNEFPSEMEFDGVVLMASHTSKSSFTKAMEMKKEWEAKGKTCIFAVNKTDVKEKEVSEREVSAVKGISVSAKTNKNIEIPLLLLMKEMTGKQHLHFVEAPAVIPPTVNF